MSDINQITITALFIGVENELLEFVTLDEHNIPLLVIPIGDQIKSYVPTMPTGCPINLIGELGTSKDYTAPQIFAYYANQVSDGNFFNSVIVSGRLGRDPDVKFFESGDASVNASIAVNTYRDNREVTNWVNIRAYRRGNDIPPDKERLGGIAGVLTTQRKGDNIAITGRIVFTDAGEGKMPYHDVNIIRLSLLSRNTKNNSNGKLPKSSDFEW